MRWEYKVVTYNNLAYDNSDEKLEKFLTSYGVDGWELVSATPEIDGYGSEGDITIKNSDIKFIFKKQR